MVELIMSPFAGLMATIQEQLKALPTCPGVYFFYDDEGRLLYIGKSVNLRNRSRSWIVSR
jgi:excinuclease UvrABC nuclease subunit